MSIVAPNIEEFGSPIYALSPDVGTNLRISAVLNEAAHVFDWHAEGLWKTEYKDGFARLLTADFGAHPKLIRSVLDLNDRVFAMVAYRAVQILAEEAKIKPNPAFKPTPQSGAA